jgi:phosphoribosylformylglycinamidine synthase
MLSSLAEALLVWVSHGEVNSTYQWVKTNITSLLNTAYEGYPANPNGSDFQHSHAL